MTEGTKATAVPINPGVLTKRQVTQLFESDAIKPLNFPRPDIDGSAFDLRLGQTAWRLEHGERPATGELTKLLKKATAIAAQEDGSGAPFFLLERRKIYLIELDYELNLPANISGRATGRSSIGRLDIITRLITKESREYDIVEEGYNGRLYVLVVPQTFSVLVGVGDTLSQLRLFAGPQSSSVIDRDLIKSYGTPFWYLRKNENPSEYEEPRFESGYTAEPTLCDLTVDLADPHFPYIYEAIRETAEPIDLRKGEKSHDPRAYFRDQDIVSDDGARFVVLKENDFYIMKSRERLHIPNDVAVEVVAISERIGDIRIHYAGFAHPGFGRHDSRDAPGTPLIFEVRATDMATKLYDGSLLARIQLFRTSTVAEPKPSAYDRQELKLSSVFRDWGNR